VLSPGHIAFQVVVASEYEYVKMSVIVRFTEIFYLDEFIRCEGICL